MQFSPMKWNKKAFFQYTFGAIAVLAACTSVQAQQGQSMEDRLRAQLRSTTEQLHKVQNELAVLRGAGGQATAAAPAAPQGDVAALKKELERAKSANSRSSRAEKESREAVEKANALVAQYKETNATFQRMINVSETERRRLASQEAFNKETVAQCEAKNVKLYTVGQEILRAYETMDMASVLSSRQPFAAQSRVKYEQIAQEYGDKLYDGKFDARAVQAPAPQNNAAAPATTTTTQ
jgi:colicin import membrane protein